MYFVTNILIKKIIYIDLIKNIGGNKLTGTLPNDPGKMTYLSNLLLSKRFCDSFLSKFVCIIFLIVFSTLFLFLTFRQ